MIVLASKSTEPFYHRLIILFGAGFLGAQIIDCLKALIQFNITESKTNWTDVINFEISIDRHLNTISFLSCSRVDWVWCAGKAGFMSKENDCDLEFSLYSAFLNRVLNLERAHNFRSFIHVVSSAGGLFEGQRVTPQSKPEPRRPYGYLKLKQENLVRKMFPDQYKIYRPSTIFGYSKNNKRLGLVTTLILNTVAGKITNINGRLNTLRDYVWLADISKFIALEIISQDRSGDIFFLVSGKPTSIFEIQTAVQRVTNLKVLSKFDNAYSNSESILYSPSLKPKDLYNSDLLNCIQNLHTSYITH